MAYIRTKKTKSGKVYREVVESYWDKEKKGPRQRVIRYMGMEEEDEQGKKKLKTPSRLMDAIERTIPIGRVALYYAAAREIGLPEVLKKHFPNEYLSILALIMNQICKRRSLEKGAKWFNELPIAKWEGFKECALDRNDLDGALEKLCYYENGVKVNTGLTIQQEMAEKCQNRYETGRKYLFYDVTKVTYFGYKCSLSQKSYNTTHRGKHTIGLGFVTSMKNGLPVRCGPIPGSKNDTITLEDMVFALENWGYKKTPLIVDRGLMSARNIAMVRKSGMHIIGCCPETSKQVVEALSLWNDDEICNYTAAVKRPSGDIVYVKGRKSELYGQSGMLVIVLDPKLKALEKSNRDIMLKEFKETTDKKRIKELRKALAPVVVKSRGRYGCKVDETLVEVEERKDGRYLMFCTDQRLSAKRVFTSYFQRDEIEKTFKCLKGELSLGPIRYQRPERIEAYTTVVFLSYMLRALVKLRLQSLDIDLSVNELVNSMDSISLVEYSYKDKMRSKISRFTTTQEKIIKAIKIDAFIHSAENR